MRVVVIFFLCFCFWFCVFVCLFYEGGVGVALKLYTLYCNKINKTIVELFRRKLQLRLKKHVFNCDEKRSKKEKNAKTLLY